MECEEVEDGSYSNYEGGLFKLSHQESAPEESERQQDNLSRRTESNANFDFDKYLLQTSHNGSDQVMEIPVKNLMEPVVNNKTMKKKASQQSVKMKTNASQRSYRSTSTKSRHSRKPNQDIKNVYQERILKTNHSKMEKKSQTEQSSPSDTILKTPQLYSEAR